MSGCLGVSIVMKLIGMIVGFWCSIWKNVCWLLVFGLFYVMVDVG